MWPSAFLQRVGTLEVSNISRLNTRPMCAPVNASPPSSRTAAHDSESAWLATPSPSGSFIHDTSPVLPAHARIRKKFRDRRPQVAANGRDEGQPTPLFRGRLRSAAIAACLGRRGSLVRIQSPRPQLKSRSGPTGEQLPVLTAGRRHDDREPMVRPATNPSSRSPRTSATCTFRKGEALRTLETLRTPWDRALVRRPSCARGGSADAPRRAGSRPAETGT